MSVPPFVHLHCHTHYSLLDGASRIDALVERAKTNGQTALAITDHGNLHGALEFYTKARDGGINPILGYEAYVAPGHRRQKDGSSSKEAAYHLTLLAQNRIGFQNLVKLSSKAFLEGFHYKPRIDRELLEAHSEGIICLSGCVSGEFSTAFVRGAEPDVQRAIDVATWFQKVFGNRYYIEIQNNGLPIQQMAMEGAIDVANRLGLPLVATSDAHYVNRDDAEVQDILLCINTGKLRVDKNRMKMEGNEFYLRSAEEMLPFFRGYEDAIARSQEIADTVDIELDLGQRHFPVFNPPKEKAPSDYLRELCLEGLKERYTNSPHRYQDGQFAPEVLERLDRELDVINKLGFPNYFLIVWDFVHYAKQQGIQATARGSGVGALVSYALYLSHVCPLEYDLLFERFLDLSRKEPPDIDIDFEKERRSEVIEYVRKKYGSENVAQIGTFGTLAARAAIRDVGRALNWPIPKVDRVKALIPEKPGVTIDATLGSNQELKQLYAEDPDTKELIDLARKLEGLARNVGTHAAAVVIADKPLIEYLPLQRDKEGQVITQWSMNDVERAGLLKMDFLGLRNLTILSQAVKLIEQCRGEKVDPYAFPLTDQATFALLCRGETKGVFQLESGGIRDLLQRMKPDHFRDIIATNALYRPGPLEGGMVDDYIAVKHGRKEPVYKHPVMKEVLEETHGVMVYQEQVMRILNRLGDIPLSDAYKCIKAISKKKLPIIAKYQEEFIKGSVAKGLKKTEAQDMFSLIEKFAGYGFNKCLVGDTVVHEARSGEKSTVGDLFARRAHLEKEPFLIHSVDGNGRLQPRRVTDVVWNGRKQVYRLTTAQGKQITATDNHPFLTYDGWTNLGDLQPGDRIAAPRRLPTAGDDRWPDHEVIALAGLLAEGNTCHPTCLYFYNNDRALIDDFVAAAEAFPDSVARLTARDVNRWEVCVSTGRDTRFAPGQRPWNAAAGGAAVAEPALSQRCGMFLWAKELGLIGQSAAKKSVPTGVYRLPDDQLALFLGRLWAGDGFMGAAGQMPYFATSSRQLAVDVQTLLLRVGILSGIDHKVMKYRYRGEDRPRDGYTVHLFGDDSIDRFLELIAPHAIGRHEQVERFQAHLATIARDRSSKDTIPPQVSQLINEQRRQHGWKWRDLEAAAGLSIRDVCRKSVGPKRGYRRSTIRKWGEFFDCNELIALGTNDLFWDRIESIEPAGVEDTYDLTVEEHHNFVADGLVVHNSHSTAYALIAYMTAYLKAHYPTEFMAALLTSDIDGRNFKHKDSLVEHIEDCRRMQIPVLPPDVNRSEVQFAAQDGQIFFALSAIKGCGTAACEAIVAERKAAGPYRDLFDLCARIESSVVGRGVLENLIKAGAMDRFGANRRQMLLAVEKALQAGSAAQADRRAGQKSLFGDDDDDDDAPATAGGGNLLPDVEEFDEREKLAAEKEVLGFYLTSHPLAEHEHKLRSYCSHTTGQLPDLSHRAEVLVGGMLGAIKISQTRKARPGSTNTQYAMFDLEDLEGLVRCIVWPEQYAQFGQHVMPDALIAAKGKIDKRPGSDEVNLIVDELFPLEELERRYTRKVVIRIFEEQHGISGLEQLYEVLRGFPGEHPLELLICLADGSRAFYKADKVKISLDPEMQRRVDELLGPGNLRLVGNSANGRRAASHPPRPASAVG